MVRKTRKTAEQLKEEKKQKSGGKKNFDNGGKTEKEKRK